MVDAWRSAARSILVLLLLAGSSAAADAPFDACLLLESRDQVRLEGSLVVAARGGGFFLNDSRAEGIVRMEGVTGELRWWTWSNARVAGAYLPPDSEAVEPIPVRNATLEFRFQREAVTLLAHAREDAEYRFEATLPQTGRQAHLDADVPLRSEALPTSRVEALSMTWPAGAAFLGKFEGDGLSLLGFPALDAAPLDLRGVFLAQVDGGNVTIRQEGTEPRTLRLGFWQEPTPAADATVARVRSSRLVLDARVASSAFEARGNWGLATPDLRWRLDGEAAWTGATGSVTAADGTTRRFEDARVIGRGAVEIRPFLPVVATLDRPVRGAEADGAWSRLTVDGAAIHPTAADPDPGIAAVAAGATGAALLLALLAHPALGLAPRVAALLYTRVGAADVLRHERRRAIAALVLAEPGIHLREMQRRLGGAWGPLTFHVRMLERTGHLRLRREGRFLAAYPPDAPASAGTPSVRHPVARRILDAIPADGAPVALAALRAELDLSRQLLTHHVERLAAEEHLVLVGAGRGRMVARRGDAPPDGAGDGRASFSTA